MNNVGQESTIYSPNFEAYGNTYIVWGTDWVLQNYIVVSASFSDRIIEFDVEQGAGFTAMVALLNDGKDAEIEVVDTTQFSPPTIQNNPYTIVSPSGTISMLMVANKQNYARKREGMRTFTFKSFTGINLGAGTTI